MFDVMFICGDDVADANMLWPWWIYVLESYIVLFHDLIVMLMHDIIMIDRLMTWTMMTEVDSH